MVPNNSSGGMADMYKNLTVPPNTNLEVYFTCLIIGWNQSNEPLVRMNNPVLQVIPPYFFVAQYSK